MNVYDQAHSLAKAIKESEEFKQYKAQEQIIDANPDLKAMIDDYQKRQMEVQAAQMMGEDTQESIANLQKSAAIIMSDPTAATYLQCQMRYALMMQDVFQIIGEL